MGSLAIRARTKLFGISRGEADFERRGFDPARPGARACLEAVGTSFIDGYNAWLSDGLDAALSQLPGELRGFAVEGAAMASALLDHLTFWRRDRWAQLLRERPEHLYMIHVGAGWATARLKLSLRRAVRRRDPLLGWLVADGWGFHQTYFHPAQWATGRKRVSPRGGYLARAVDQGVGRALWFVAGADPLCVANKIGRFSADRHADLWSGVGLAATYAGGCAQYELQTLVELAGEFRAQLAQGAAFAATARTVAENVTAPTRFAARAISGLETGELHQLAMQCLPAAPHDPAGKSYEIWRTRLAGVLAKRGAA
jgi:enediyne biosynthesis protein E3